MSEVHMANFVSRGRDKFKNAINPPATKKGLSQNLQDVLKQFSSESTIEYAQAISNNEEELNKLGEDVDGALKLPPDSAKKFCGLYCYKAARIVLGRSRVLLDGVAANVSDRVRYYILGISSWDENIQASTLIQPTDIISIALAIRLITVFHRQFSVRETWSNPQISRDWGTVVLDMRNLDRVHIEKNICSVGPGAPWNDIYRSLEERKLAAVGYAGKITGPVTAGGVLTRGHISHFPNSGGLPCDNVEEIEIVLADSRVIKANSNHHPTLFRASKGFGSHLGIISRISIRTNPNYKVWQRSTFVSRTDPSIIDDFVELATAIDSQPAAIDDQPDMPDKARYGIRLRLAGRTYHITLWHSGRVESTETPLLFRKFVEKHKSYSAVQDRTLYWHEHLFVDKKPPRAHEALISTIGTNAPAYRTLIDNHPAVDRDIQIELEFIPLAALDAEQAKRRSNTAVSITPAAQTGVRLITVWKDEKDDGAAWEEMKKMTSKISKAAESQNEMEARLNGGEMLKFRGPNFKLAASASLEYDPKGVFRTLQTWPDGPLQAEAEKLRTVCDALA